MEPQKDEAEGTRERLLAAAQHHFLQDGFEGAGVAAILGTAGVKAPSLYYHFGDKEGLYTAATTANLTALGQQLRRTVDTAPSLREGLAGLVLALADTRFIDLGTLAKDIPHLRSHAHRDAVTAVHLEQVHEPICGFLLQGIQRGELRSEPIGKMAAVLISGALAARANLPGASIGSDFAWWADRFAAAFRP